MKRNHFYRAALLIITIFYFTSSYAKKASGFIVENSDTLYGKIKYTQFNILTAGIVINGINTESLHYEVWFKENNGKRFKKYTPNDIDAFGFTDKDYYYYFKSFAIKTNSVVKKERIKKRFLQLYFHVADIDLYKDLLRIDNHYFNSSNSSYKIYEQTYTYPELYLFSGKNGLTKIEESKKIGSIKEILQYYKIEDEFLIQISKDCNLKNIRIILEEYKLWLNRLKIRSTNI